MGKVLHITIKQRIYLSFLLVVVLFVVNAVITITTLNNSKKLSERLTTVVDPSLDILDDFRGMMVESKMLATNWVFLRYKQDDKESLQRLHRTGYDSIKRKLRNYSVQWADRKYADSVTNVFSGFEELMGIEKRIMRSLQDFSDYDDPVIKLEAERLLEDEILPRTAALMTKVTAIYDQGMKIRSVQNIRLTKATTKLRLFIAFLAITVMGAALLLSIYLTKVIIAPLRQISRIVNDLGKGVTRRIDYRANGDEIGMMVRSINNLSDKLQATANFAHEVGMRNFKMPFQPLSEEDTLGKSLIAMRENLHKGELSLEIKNRELERKNKELEQFAYVASHDLQEPLRTISSFVDLFARQYHNQVDEKAEKYLEYIVQSSSRMQVLIRDLLEYSRIGNNKKLQQVDCNAVLKEVLADLDAAIRETGAVVKSGNLPVVTGYATEIKQLFQNLVFNAIKFRKKENTPEITVSAQKAGDHWQFEFKDNGIGIAKEHHERIFIIFQRLHTRNEYPGSGIGLSHCKKIVELHKGKIWLQSEPGIGTSFYFTI